MSVSRAYRVVLEPDEHGSFPFPSQEPFQARVVDLP